MTTENYQQIFTEIYTNNLWKDQESRSGPGSTIMATRILIEQLPILFQTFGIKSILDLACGDVNWMKMISMPGIDYQGADIVKNLIDHNKKTYPDRKFLHLDLLTDSIPKVDLVICRDCLTHFPNHAIRRALFNLCLSRSKFLLTTNFPNHQTKDDIVMGQWRPLNLQSKLFGLPEPLFSIREGFIVPEYSDKSQSLWTIDSIKLALLA